MAASLSSGMGTYSSRPDDTTYRAARLYAWSNSSESRTLSDDPVTRIVHSSAAQKELEVPLYIGLTVHAATRKKHLVDKLFSVGVCVSYDRVMSVLNDLARGLCNRFELDKAVCPLNFTPLHTF